MFYVVFIFVVLQRLVELFVAKRNEEQMLRKGAYEVGASHYPYMLALHIGFLISLFTEVVYGKMSVVLHTELLFLFFLLQFCRIWCVTSLGPFWNTKILILPGTKLVAKGPYAYIRHPNYIVVCLEIAVLPLMFEAYVTAIIFTVLNLWMLSVRIPIEERALKEI